MRIVSLLPSATEIVAALGHLAELVGRSEECDYPSEVKQLPVVMRAKTHDADRPSAAIDARVREERATGASLYTLDLDTLKHLRPDLIATQDLCRVCSVTDEEVTSACAQAGLSPRIVSLNPTRLTEVWDSVDALGAAIGDPDTAGKVTASLRKESSAEDPKTRRSVGVVEWLDPPILAGLWAADQVEAAGGISLGPGGGARAQRTTWPELFAQQPDLLVVSPCSFSISRTRGELKGAELGELLSRARVPLGIWLADEAYFSRPGPRLANGVALLRALLRSRSPPTAMPYLRWS